MAAWTRIFQGPVLLLFVVLWAPQAVRAAPYEQDTTEIEYYPIADSTGCYYNFQHYDEGDRIITNEPCLNCTCHNRMLMCYLRVCPFTKAIGQDCKIEKRADQCCPVITCPEVPVQLLTSTTQSSTAVGHLDAYGCSIDGLFYSDGARVPSDPNKPCELCYCIRNKTACVMQECTLKVEGCKPVYQEGVCCPVRYDCEHPDYNLLETTTRRLITTTTQAPTTTLAGPVDCVYNNEVYADGALVIKEKPCEHCYCMRGDIVCAVQECNPTPLDKVNCTALPPKEGQCCADSYDCDHMTEEDLTTGYLYTTPSLVSFDEKATVRPEIEPATTQQPIGKEGETQEPVTVVPSEAEKEHPEQLPEIPEKEDHEEPVKGVTSLFDEQAHVTEPQEVPTTVKAPQEQESNEIPEEHEIVTAGPHIPSQDEIVYPQETEYPKHSTEEHEAGSGEGQVTEQETEIPGQATESPEIGIPKGTELPQSPETVTETKASELPEHATEAKVQEITEKPEHVTEGNISELPPTVTEAEHEQPQHVPVEEHEPEEEEEEEHVTEYETHEGKGTELPHEQGPEEPEAGTTEHPHVIQHVTEIAPEIGSGLPHEMAAVTERTDGKGTEIPQEEHIPEVTEKEQVGVTQIPSGHVPKGEEEGQQPVEEGTKVPEEHVTETQTVKAGEIPQVPESVPQEHVTEGVVPEHGLGEKVTEIPTAAGEGTEVPEEHVPEGGITGLPPKDLVYPTEIPEGQVTEGHELPKEYATELPKEHIAELPKEHVTQLPEEQGTELPKEGTELPREHATEVPEEQEKEKLPSVTESSVTEHAPEQIITVVPEELIPVEKTKEHTTHRPETETETSQEQVTEGQAKGESTELPEEHVTEEISKKHEVPKEPSVEEESTKLPEEHITQGPESESPTVLPAEHVTEAKIGEEPTEQPKEHATDVPAVVGPVTELPSEHTTEEHVHKATELPEKEHITEHPVLGVETTKQPAGHVTEKHIPEGTTLLPEYITEGHVDEGKVTEQPQAHVTEQGRETEASEGQVTEVPQPHADEGQITEHPEEELHVTEGQVKEKPEIITEGKLDETTKYAEEPTPVEGELPENYPVEHDHVPEVPEQQTEKAVPEVPETETETATSAPSEEAETEKTRKTTIKPSLIGQTEKSVTEHEAETHIPIKPSEEAEGTTPRLPQMPVEEEQETESAIGKVTEQPKEKETEIPQQATDASRIPSEEFETSNTPGEPSGEVTEEPTYPHAGHEGVEEEEKPGIPGEGSCLVDGQTYKNNSNVPPINHCQVSCKCMSSILQCESVTCTPPPSNLQHCMPVYQGPDSCCPTYSCSVPGVTSMESDSHKVEISTTETIPGTVGVNILIPSEEGIVKPEGTTASSRDSTELPEYSLPEEHVTHEQPGVSEASVTPESYVPPATTIKSVPAHTEVPVETATGTEKIEGQVTEKQGELQPTEISHEATTLKSSSESEQQPEVHVTTDYPEDVRHDEVHPDEGENAIEDHTYSHVIDSGRDPTVTEQEEEEITTPSPALVTEKHPVFVTETEEEKATEGPEKPIEGEAPATEIPKTEGKVPAVTQGVIESVPEVVTEGVTAGVTEIAHEGTTVLVTEPALKASSEPSVEEEAKVTTEPSKEGPVSATEPVGEYVPKGEVGKEESASATTEYLKPSIPEAETKLPEAVTEGKKELPEIPSITSQQEHVTEGVKEQEPHYDEGAQPHEDHVTEIEIPATAAPVTEGKAPEQETEEEIIEVATEPSATEKVPESISHVTEKTQEGQLPTHDEGATQVPQIPEKTSEKGKPVEEPEVTTAHVPAVGVTEPVVTVLPEHKPTEAEEMPEHKPEAGITERVGGEEHTTPRYVSAEGLPELAPGTKQPEGTTVQPEGSTAKAEEHPETVQLTHEIESSTAKTAEEPHITTVQPGYESEGSTSKAVEQPEITAKPGYEHEGSTPKTDEAQPEITAKPSYESEATTLKSVGELEGSTAQPSHEIEGAEKAEITTMQPSHEAEQPEITTALPGYEHEGTTIKAAGQEPEITVKPSHEAKQPEITTALPGYEHEGTTIKAAGQQPEITVKPSYEPEGTTLKSAEQPEITVKPFYEPEGTTVKGVEQPEITAKPGYEHESTTLKSAEQPEITTKPSYESEGTTVKAVEHPEFTAKPGYEPEGTTLKSAEQPEITAKPTYELEGTTLKEIEQPEITVKPSYEPKGTEQPEITIKPGYELEGTTLKSVEQPEVTGKPAYEPEKTTVKSDEHPEITVKPSYEPEGTEQPEITAKPGYESEGTTLKSVEQPEVTTIKTGYVPEGSTEPGIPEKEEPSVQTTPRGEESEVTEKETKPFVYIPPTSDHEHVPEEGGVTEKEGESYTTIGYKPETTIRPEHIPSEGEAPKTTEEEATEPVVTVTAVPALPEGQQPEEGEEEAPTRPIVPSLEEEKEKSTEVPTTVRSPISGEETTEPRPAIPGEGQEIPETSTKPEVFTSPTLTSTTQPNTTELYTSGPTTEESTKKSVTGELSTSAPSTTLTSSTTLPPPHSMPESPDYQAPVEEEDYGEEDQSAFGPGTCRYGGKVYVSAQQIPRDDPCDFCFCFRSDIICLQQSCPPPIPRCHEEPIRGFCCPRYECPVSMATSVNITTTTTTTTTTLPPHFFSHAYKGRAQRSGCQIRNKAYQVGEEIKSASGPCLHCICGDNGQMKCDPKACSPEPMLRQMIAAAESRRRR